MYDIFGQLTDSKEITNDNTIFDTSQLSKGLYFFKIEIGKKSYLKKVIVY